MIAELIIPSNQMNSVIQRYAICSSDPKKYFFFVQISIMQNPFLETENQEEGELKEKKVRFFMTPKASQCSSKGNQKTLRETKMKKKKKNSGILSHKNSYHFVPSASRSQKKSLFFPCGTFFFVTHLFFVCFLGY